MQNITKKSLISAGSIGLLMSIGAIMSNYFRFSIIAIVIATILLCVYTLEFSLNNKEEVKQSLKFLILPVLFNAGGLYFITIFFQKTLQVTIILMLAVANYYLWVGLKKIHNLGERAAIFNRNVIVTLSFMSVFLSISGAYRIYVSVSTIDRFGFYQLILTAFIFAVIYLSSYFLAWANGADVDKFRPYNLVNALFCAELAWVATFWIVNYPILGDIEKSNIGGSPLPAILITIVYYFIWGLVSHKVDKSLNRKIFTEYAIVTIVFIAVLFISARWLPSA